MRVMVMLCVLASTALAEPKRPPFANVNVTPPRPQPVKAPPVKPAKPPKPPKPAKPPTPAELAFEARRAACKETLVLARQVDQCLREVMVALKELDKDPTPYAPMADRYAELVAPPLDTKSDAETTALCVRERTRLEQIAHHACRPAPVGCYF